MLSTVIFYLPFLLLYAVFAIYAERKISAFIQDRLGPMEVGPYGIAQTVADLLKLLQKEDIVPGKSGSVLFRSAPVMLFAVVFTAFAVLPVSMAWPGTGLPTGIYFWTAIISLDVIAMVIAGWSSNNKYSTLGAFRSAAQIISYEIPLGLSIVCVCMVCSTLDLHQISLQQSTYTNEPQYLFGIAALNIDVSNAGGFLTWNVLRMPALFFVWIVFFIATLAECNRAPFDLPEAESELIAGFHTEYSGFRWGTIMLAEYGMMLLVSILGAILFFGSWNSPLPNIGAVRLSDWTNGTPGNLSATLWGAFWLMGKALLLVSLQMWVRWTYPRLRVDQLMNLSWKFLTPVSLLLLVICGIWKLTLL